MSPLRRLVPYLLRYRDSFVAGLVCSVATTSIALTSPLVLRYAVDDLAEAVTRGKLVLYAAVLLGIGLVGGLFRFLTRRILIGASRHIEYDMRNDFFAHLEALPLAYFQMHRTGDLMSRATNDLNAVRMMVGPAVMYSANTLLTFVAALALMVSIDGRLTLLSLIPLPFVSLSVKYFGTAIHKRFERIQAQLSEVSAIAQESLSGVRVVRAYRQEQAELDRFRLANLEYLRRNRGLITIQGFFFPSMGLFLGLGSMLVLWLGSREVIAGRITLGQFVAFNAWLGMLAWPMIAFGWVTNMIQRGMASWKRMLEVLDTEPAIQDESPQRTQRTQRSFSAQESNSASSASSAVSIRGDIEFRNLVFSFGGTRVLDHVSAHIPAGQTAALVGVTGSGKSTLVGLLARLHDPPPGTVFVDGVDVREMPLATLRGSIGLVPQDPFLFSDTLADNVAFGLDAIAGEHLRPERPFDDAQGRPEPVEGRGAGEARPPSESERGWGPASSGKSWAGTTGGAHKAGAAGRAVEDRAGEAGEERRRKILAAAAVARLDKDVADFPKGYDTMVGERGITLSGGQKQRTALARAVIVDPKILILDDALSAVDTYTEEEILTRLRAVMRRRTSILVSHRISTVRSADQILVLDEGRIAERGTHDELIRQDGLYADLHRKQLLEEELAAF